MAAIRHIAFLGCIKDHSSACLYGLPKFGCNRCCSVDNIKVVTFCVLSLKTPIDAIKLEFWALAPLNGGYIYKTPNRYIIAWVCVDWVIGLRENLSNGLTCRWVSEKGIDYISNICAQNWSPLWTWFVPNLAKGSQTSPVTIFGDWLKSYDSALSRNLLFPIDKAIAVNSAGATAQQVMISSDMAISKV